MIVKDVMTHDPVMVPPTMAVEAVAQLLADQHISGAFVVAPDGTPLGIVTEADLIRRISPGHEDEDLGWIHRFLIDEDRAATRYVRTHGTSVGDVMTPDAIVVEETAPIEDAVEQMRKRHVRRVGVVRNQRLVGVLSRADLLKAVISRSDQIDVSTDDERIRQSILFEMQRQPWAHPGSVTVLVQEGIVRLEGYCRSAEARRALLLIAERVDGVRQVHDRLQEYPEYDFPTLPMP